MRATDELNNSMDVIYYLGVIDICTPYNAAKRIEHAWKSMTENPVTISCVDPVTYGHRFLDFLMSVMRGGDPALRPQGLEFPRGQDADSVPVGSEHDKAAHPRPIFVDTAALTSSPQIVPEGDEGEEADETQVITAVDVDIDGLEALPPTIVAVERTETPVETTDEVAAQHDIACEECSDHTRPAIVGHLKVN
jgi:1-phosphatidylinositol-4-phosphate 5-kinase